MFPVDLRREATGPSFGQWRTDPGRVRIYFCLFFSVDKCMARTGVPGCVLTAGHCFVHFGIVSKTQKPKP